MNDIDRASVIEQIRRQVAVLDVSMNLRFQSAEKALELETGHLKIHLDKLNNSTEKIEKMRSEFIPRLEWKSEHTRLEKDVEELKAFKERSLGRLSVISVGVSVATSVMVGMILNFFLK
jgi:hypothetical protein